MKKISIFLMLCLAFFGVANAQQNLPYSYGFEDNDLTTDGWSTQNPSGLNASEFGIIGTAAQNGSYGFRFSSYNDRGESTQYLISPELNAPKGVVVRFSYKASASYTSGETFQVGYSTTDTDIASFTFGTANNATNTTWAQTEEMILPAGTKYVAVYYSANYQYRLYVDDFTFAEPPACIPATNLAVTTDGQTATATWDGTAANNFIVTVNGVAATGNQTSPYTFNVNLSTTYEVVVTADCGADGTSDPLSYTFTTPDCIGGHTIEYVLNDSYGDGWNGNAINIIETCDNYGTLTLSNGSTQSGSFVLCGDYYEFSWVSGGYASETSFTLIDNGTTIYSGQSGSSFSDGQVLYTIGTAPTCIKPTGLTAGTPTTTSVMLNWTENGTAAAWQICVNGDEANPIDVTDTRYELGTGAEGALTPDTDYTVKVRANCGAEQSCWSDVVTFHTDIACERPTALTEANITTDGATLSWTGTHDRYTVQLTPWLPAGTDVLPTATMTRYTFPLTGTGTGSVTIRHYDVTNMFRLIVDDIIVKNAAGEVIYTQDFETSGGAMPSEFSAMDVDGDGYGWDVVDNNNSYVNGSYGLSSASWTSTAGALFPDNWIILNGIELGGEISFVARGQDPSFAAEKFCVYVCANANMIEDYTTETRYSATGLTPNTPYTWQVSGLCSNGFESQPAASLFQTLDDVIVFTTDGDWDDASNWDLGRVPTGDDKVRLDATATINSGVVAYAKKIVTASTGSVIILDGGQFKQGETSVVTIKKQIEAVGDSNWVYDNYDGYYFIASPLTTTLFSYQTDWAYVDITSSGTYDLYSFDAENNQWLNYIAHDGETDYDRFFARKGYLYANKDGYTLTFEGSTAVASLNNVVTEEVTFDATSTSPANGYVLVGNPFTCNAYLSFVDAGGNELAADFYVLNNSNDFTSISSNDPIAPCTGAMIDIKAVGAGTLKYSSEAPTTSKSGALTMNVTNGRGNVDMARVRFGNGLNLRKKSFRENSSKLYLTEGNEDYAVIYADNQGEMPVSFKAESNGTYTISFNTENVEFGYLHLIDNMTGNDVDLLANPSYTFNASTTDYASRFRLVFNANGINEYSNDFAFISNGQIILNGQGTVEIYDVNGRMISRNTEVTTIATDNMSAGVYMLRLINGSDIKTQKIVVK